MDTKFLFYNGHIGSYSFSEEDNSWIGKIEGIDDTVIFDYDSEEDLKENFPKIVNDYIEFWRKKK